MGDSLKKQVEAVVAELKVDRAELVRSLKILLRLVKKKDAGDAVFSFEDGYLSIDLGGVSAMAPAEGQWPGEARVAGNLVFGLAKTLPAADPLPIRCENGRIFIDRFSAPCEWRPTPSQRIEPPLDAPPGWLLSVSLTYPEEQIRDSGLTPLVEKAKQRREACVAKAAQALSPFGVDPQAVEEFVDGYVRKTWKV